MCIHIWWYYYYYELNIDYRDMLMFIICGHVITHIIMKWTKALQRSKGKKVNGWLALNDNIFSFLHSLHILCKGKLKLAKGFFRFVNMCDVNPYARFTFSPFPHHHHHRLFVHICVCEFCQKRLLFLLEGFVLAFPERNMITFHYHCSNNWEASFWNVPYIPFFGSTHVKNKMYSYKSYIIYLYHHLCCYYYYSTTATHILHFIFLPFHIFVLPLFYFYVYILQYNSNSNI